MGIVADRDRVASPAPPARRSALPRPLDDRRDPATRECLRQRLRAEFTEMPGLTLTLAQAVRLFGIHKDVCVRVLGELSAEGLVYRTLGAQYRRRPARR